MMKAERMILKFTLYSLVRGGGAEVHDMGVTHERLQWGMQT